MADEHSIKTQNETALADRNWRRFVWFRVLFNARFYYPVLAVFFLDLGLSATEYTLLNFAWALAIVAVDLPAGVLADRIGRRPLVVLAAVAMVLEMVLLCVAPQNGGRWLFLCCLANRLLSGAAEGMASGADEALVFDSLAERGREKEWPLVLDQVLRWQSLGFLVAMLVGGAVYDPAFMGWLLHTPLAQTTTLRFPIYLNLLSAVVTLIAAVGLREPGRRSAGPSEEKAAPAPPGSAWGHLREAGHWIARTPLALFAIVAGVGLDSIVRLFMTFTSSYLRLIHLPAATYGPIGAAMAGLGFAVAPVARRLVLRGAPAANFFLLAGVVLLGLGLGAARLTGWGVLALLPLGVAMSAVGYLVSYYLNAAVESRHRATVLSFKGLAFNLGYGFVSLAFAGALRAQRGADPQAVFGGTLPWLPMWLVAVVVLGTLGFWRHRQVLGKAPAPAAA